MSESKTGTHGSAGGQVGGPETATRVAAVIEDLFGVPATALTPEVTLQDGLQLDSLSVVELQVAVEDALEIRFDPQSTADIETFGDLVAAVDAMLADNSAERKAS